MSVSYGGDSITFADSSTIASGFTGFKNRVINGGMDIAQRGNTFTSTSSANNDDTYVLDRFYILSDGNDIVDVTQTTTVPTGAKYSIGLDVETVDKKFGIAQIIENANCYDAIGGNVTISFQAKVSATANLDNIKCAIVAWSGTADTVTSDIISAWGVEGTNPTLIANATYENTPANLGVTTSFATYSVTANVDTASTSNIILFIWSDVTTTALGEFLYITNVQLEKGSTATSFEYRGFGRELIMCQRYFEKSYAQGVVPGTTTDDGRMLNAFGTSSSGYIGGFISYRVIKRAAATPSVYAASNGTITQIDSFVFGTSTTRVTPTIQSPIDTGFGFYFNGTTANAYAVHYAVSAEL